MEKRYQVFVSSTFTDLEEERHGLMQTLMQLDCIPAGMELFPATDEEQWAFIQKVIDDCDYYLLVVGGRYGSTTEQGISYTEKEHDYAVSKGIHVIALLHGEPEKLPLDKSELDSTAREKLSAFRTKASSGRLVKYWKSPAELLQRTVLSLTHAFKAHPRLGWVRGGGASNPELLLQINELRQRNDELTTKIQEMRAVQPAPIANLNLASAESLFAMRGTYHSQNRIIEWSAELSWNQIIAVLGPHLLSPLPDNSIRTTLAVAVRAFTGQTGGINTTMNLAAFDTIKVQLLALGYIEVDGSFWRLTDLGKQVMFQTRTIKAENTTP